MSRDDFVRHEAYTNHLHPYLFFIYGCTKLVQLLTGLPMSVGRNVTPFAMTAVGVCAFATLLFRNRAVSRRDGSVFYVSLFVVLGIFISEAHYWTYLYTGNFDSVFPLIVYLAAIVLASAEPRISSRRPWGVIATAALFGAFGWVYTPILIVALWCGYGRRARTLRRTFERNRVLIRASVAGALLSVATYSLPLMLVAAKGYTSAASPFLFRSGLDGDTSYFHDMTQAVFRPFWGAPRTVWSLLFPAFIPLMVCGVAVAATRSLRYRFVSQCVFLIAFYVFSVALFPQSVSIHPYLYDQLLFLPVALLGGIWSLTAPVQGRLRGPYLLAALLGIGILIASNFIGIAQAMRTA